MTKGASTMARTGRRRVAPRVEAQPEAVDQDLFRHVAGHFASGVTVLTTLWDDEPLGATASAVSSLSLEPPMMLACLHGSSRTHEAVHASGRFAVNVLAVDQDALAQHFAGKGDDKFAAVGHDVSPHGLPVLRDALATIECIVDDTAVGGTHTVFLGTVVAAAAGEGRPLGYYRGGFGTFEALPEVAPSVRPER